MPSLCGAIYYPDCHIFNRRSLATYLLLYDELHLVALADDARDPTERFRSLPAYTQVKCIRPEGPDVEFVVSASEIRVAGDPGAVDKQTQRTLLFYQFVHRYKALVGEAIFFHPHFLAAATNRITDKLLGGDLTAGELEQFFSSEGEVASGVADFEKHFPGLKDEALWRIVPTAMKLARERDLILVSDDPSVPVPVLSSEVRSVRNLTSILAEECVSLHVPICADVPPEAILEVKAELADLLAPFRMGLQRLSADLRSGIHADSSMDDVRREARFIVESRVEPALFELKRKIERHRSKLFNKAFGAVVRWAPLVGKLFATPTPTDLLALVSRVAGDTGALFEGADQLAYAKGEGLCFLLRLDEILGQQEH
jgi:hypothetical protein